MSSVCECVRCCVCECVGARAGLGQTRWALVVLASQFMDLRRCGAPAQLGQHAPTRPVFRVSTGVSFVLNKAQMLGTDGDFVLA